MSMAVNPLLAALGIGGATIGGGVALHGLGLGQILEPLDYPRQSLYNLFAAPYKALETGDASHLLGAIPARLERFWEGLSVALLESLQARLSAVRSKGSVMRRGGKSSTRRRSKT